MRFTTSTTVLALASYAMAASTPQLPACAQLCFLKAISETSCSTTDYYARPHPTFPSYAIQLTRSAQCQCTTGSAAIAKAAGTCLCANVGHSGGCTVAELAQVQKVTNEICSAALAASSSTYTPQTAGANYCATVGGSTATTATGTGASSMSTGTGKSMTSGSGTSMTSGSGTGSAAAASSSSSSASTGGAPLPTKMAGLEAALGLAGLVVAAL